MSAPLEPPNRSAVASGQGRGPNSYEHLGPLFVERDALAESDKRREVLREALIFGYRPVAQHIARRYRYRAENPEDLEQVAMLGLILAVDRFQPDRGNDFLSFAVPTISGEVLRYLRDRTPIIRMPRRLRALQSQIFDAVAELSQRHGRAPRPSEIAAWLGVDVADVLDSLQAQDTAHPTSLDQAARSDDENAREQAPLGGALGVVEPAYELAEFRHALGPLLTGLPERERRILLLRFFEGRTQTEIGLQVGISQMHVSRLLSRILDGLRHQLSTER